MNSQFQPKLLELSHINEAKPDTIYSQTIMFNADKNPNKVNVGIGVYKGHDLKPVVFPVLREAEKRITEDHNLDKEYNPIDGDALFNKGARGSLFGFDHPDVNSGRVATCQTLSGTGALRILGDFLHQFRPAPIYISKECWDNHQRVFTTVGLEIKWMRHLNR